MTIRELGTFAQGTFGNTTRIKDTVDGRTVQKVAKVALGVIVAAGIVTAIVGGAVLGGIAGFGIVHSLIVIVGTIGLVILVGIALEEAYRKRPR